jgi:hypothetical protein
MVELIYRKMKQWWLDRRKTMRIDWNKELTMVVPDSVNLRCGGGVRDDCGEEVDDGEHPAGSGCGWWWRDL